MRRIAARIFLGFAALVIANTALAQDYRYHLYLDRDANAATGCSETVGATTIDGAELRITANVTGTTVTTVTRADCAGAVYGGETAIGGPHPVGLNNGVNGADVIEFAIDRGLVGSSNVIHLSLAASNGAGTSSDVLTTAAGGGPILQALIQFAIPALGLLGLVLLVAAFAFVASRRLKVGLASLGALLMASAVWAANFVVDGAVGDWTGVTAIATDGQADAVGADPGAEIYALFAAEEGGRLYYRVDVADVENQVPVAQPQNLTFLEDSAAQPITLVATDGDGDPLTYALGAIAPTKGVLSGFNAATGAVTYTPNANAEGADSFSFTATDGLATSAPATISITLTPVNDAPVATDAVFSVPENTANGTSVGTPVVATDIDTTAPNNTLSYAITAGNTAGAFAINATTGQITVANSAALDFKTNPSFALTVTVSDGGAGLLSDTAAITINLGNLNEPPVFQSEPYVFALPENSAIATVVGQTPALDQDTTAPNNTLTWAITSGNASGAFAINPTTGAITVANSTPLNFETTTSFTLGISVTDGGTPTGSDTSTVTINITDVNEAPVVTGGTFSLPENSANTTAVGTATGTDVDLPAQTFTWAITAGNTGGAFAINPATGAITVATTAALDFETNPSFALTVQATDNGAPTASGTALVTVNLINVNEAPTFTGEPYTANVGENTANGTTVTSVVTATDVDAATTLTYAIAGGNTSGAFAIAAGTGVITVANSTALDFKVNPSFTLNLSVTDNGAPNLNDTSTITITVGDVNEAPVFQSEPYAFSIAENSAPATAVGSTPATDQDTPPQTLTWAITGGNTGGTFAIGAAGAITVAVAPDFETTPSYTLNISVTDNGSGNLSDTSTVAITITNVNEAPVNAVPVGPLSTGVSVPLAFTGPNSISITDVDAAAGNVTTTISTTLGTFTATAVNGATVIGSGTNSVAITDTLADVNATLQTLSFTSGSGGSASVTVLTTDNGNTGSGGAQSDSDGFTINIDAAPTVTAAAPAAAAVVADNVALSVSFSENISTINGDAVTLTCSAGAVALSSATGSNVASLSPTYAGVLPSGPCVLTVIAANVTDADLIDPPNLMAVDFTRNFTVDSAPAVTTTTPANGAGNVAANATITVNFSENVVATAGAFALNCGAGPITLTPNTIANANAITMTPGSALPPTSTCTLTVTGANVTDSDTADNPDAMVGNTIVTFSTTDPAPTVTTTLPINGGTMSANADITINFSEPVTFADASFTLGCPGAFAFVSSGSGTATATLNPTGNLPVGTTCTVNVLAAGVTDVDGIDPPDNMAANSVFSFTPVNTPPTLTAGATLNYTEDQVATAIDTTITVADPDSPNLASASATISANFAAGQDALACATPACTAGGIVVGGTAGALTLTGSAPLATYQAALRAVTYVNTSNNPSALARTVTWIGNDGIANSLAVTSTVNVAATNDAPVANAISPPAFNEDTQSIVTLSYTDAESDLATACAISAPVNVTVTQACACAAGVCTVGVTGTANFSGAASFGYTVTAAAQVSNTATATLSILPVDDAPVANAISPPAFNEDVQSIITLSYTDPDGDLASVCAVSAPTNVTVTQACACAAGVCTVGVTGTPTNYNGPASFTFTVTANAVLSNSALASLTISPVNDPPVANAISPPAFNEDTQSIITLSYTDPESDLATTCAITVPTNVTVTQACACAAGVCTVGVTGSPLNYNGAASFSYTVTAGGQPSNSAAATLTILPVNDAPVADNEAYDFLGNTELRVGLAAVVSPPNTTAATGVLVGDADPVEIDVPLTVTEITVGGCTDNAAPLTCTDVAVGTVNMNADGTFNFIPVAGDVDASESFTYRITDSGTPPATSSPATVTLNRFERVWYVSASAGAGTGISTAPLNSLTTLNGAGGVGDVDGAGDYIFVHNNGTLAGGLELEANQHLLGEGVGLSIPVNLNGNGSPTNLVAAGTRPLWNNAGGNVVSLSCAMPIEIRGLSLNSTAGNALDLTCAAALAGSGSLTITNNDFRGASVEGVDINLNAASTGALTLAFNNNAWIAGTHTGNAFDLVNANTVTLGLGFSDNTGLVSTAGAVSINDLLAAGVTTITGFANNSVSGNTGGFGLFVNNAVFDATAGAPFNVVSGGNTQVGASGNGVGTNGIILTSVTGDLSFTNLDVFNDAGVGLRASSAGAFDAPTAVGFRLAATSGTASVTSVGGPVIDFDSATIDLQSATVTGTGSASQGIRFNSARGTFSALGGSSITTGAGATNFLVNGSVMTSSYAGVLNATAGTGVNLTGNTGSTLNFTGTTTMSTGTNTAFNATGGGTISVTGATNTLITTTGTALNVVNATVAVGGLTFQSINSPTASANQVIVLTSTGAGPVTVSGTGTAGSGGTIDNKTDDAIRLNNTGGLITLNRMIIEDIGNMAGASNTNSTHDAIHGQDVNAGLSMTGTTIRRISDQAIHGATLAGAATVWNGLILEGVVIEDSNRFHVANVGDANNEGSIRVLGLRGTVSVNNSTFVRGGEFFDTFVTGGTLNMTVTNSSFTNAYKEFTVGALASVGGHCIDVVVQGAGAANVTIGNRAAVSTSNIFLNCRLGSVRFVNDTGSTGNSDFIVARNTFTVNDGSSGIGGDFDFPMGGVLAWNLGNGPGGSVVDTIVENNIFTDVTNASGGVGQLTLIAEGGLLQALVQNNSFIRPGNAPWFIQSRNTVNSNARVRFANNTITGGPALCTADPSCGGGYNAPGLRTLFDANTGATLDAVLDNNSFAGHDTGFDPGQTVEFRGLAPGGGNFCVDMTSNQADDGYSLEPFAGTMRTVGAGTCPVGSPSASCQTVMGNRNNRGGANSLLTNPPLVNVINAAVTVSGVACATPTGGPF